MDIKDAIQLITHNSFSVKNRKVWVDLGSGTGTFTSALASLLEKESIIYAIDSDASALKKIPDSNNRINLKKVIADFVNTDLPIQEIDGILMANSLHYVKDKEAFLNKLRPHLNIDACFLIIEYDSNASNLWVPYPIDFQSLKALFSKLNYANITKLNSRHSIYGNLQMYSALIQS